MNLNIVPCIYMCKIEIKLTNHTYPALAIFYKNSNNSLFLTARFTHSELYMIFYPLFTFFNYSLTNKFMVNGL